MSDPQRVESIFLAALDKKSAEERADYLDHACGADAALRQRVERMLDAHPRAVDFLAQPAIDRHELDWHEAAEGLIRMAPASGLETIPRDPMGRTDVIEPHGHGRGDDEDSALSFLQPSERPGSLGRLAHYEVLEVLGSGGFGTVVKAFDQKLHRHVAIKLLSPFLAATSAARKRFVREARAAVAVRPENVIAIYAVEDQPIPYLVMEYIAGTDAGIDEPKETLPKCKIEWDGGVIVPG